MGRYYYQVDAQLNGHLENLDCGIARHYEYFITGSGLKFLTADPPKLNLRRALDLSRRKTPLINDMKQMQGCVMFPRKFRRNRNRRERVLIEVYGAQNVTKLRRLCSSDSTFGVLLCPEAAAKRTRTHCLSFN